MPKTSIRYGNEDKVTTRLYPGDKARLKEKAGSQLIGEYLRELVRRDLEPDSRIEYDAKVIAETIGMDYEDFVKQALVAIISEHLEIETSEYLKGVFI